MKKRFALLILVVMSVICFVGCGKTSQSGSFSTLKSMANADYSVIERKIETTLDGDTLVSRFTVTNEQKTQIEYSVEQLNKLSITEMPEERKSVKSGKVVLENDAVVEQTGDSVDVDFVAMSKLRLSFEKENFANVNWNNKSMTASVANVKGFLGVSVDCKNMTVSLSYSENLNEIVVQYQTNRGALVKMTYSFTK